MIGWRNLPCRTRQYSVVVEVVYREKLNSGYVFYVLTGQIIEEIFPS
jgi:hypothetical protein